MSFSSSAEPELLFDYDGGIARLTINRPKKANSLSFEVVSTLADCACDLATRDDLRGVILRGSGDRAFSGGADLAIMNDPSTDSAMVEEYYRQFTIASDHLNGLPVPVIAVLNGAAIAGGVSLSLACNVRIAVDTAYLAYPRIQDGTMPSKNVLQPLVAAIGPSRSRLFLSMAYRLQAREAYEWGLVDMVLAQDELDSFIDDCAETLRRTPPPYVYATNRLIENPWVEAIWTAAENATSGGDQESLTILRSAR